MGAGFASSMPRAAGANATAALFGNRYTRPSHGGNSFLLGLPGGAYASGRYTEPGARNERALQQTSDAVLAILNGASPTGHYDLVLRQSAREASKAKAEIGATQALFNLYGPAPRHDPTSRAARLAAQLGVGPLGSAYSPWRRHGAVAHPLLMGRVTDLGLGRFGMRREGPSQGSSGDGGPIPPSIMRGRQGERRGEGARPIDAKQAQTTLDFDPTGPGLITSGIYSELGGESIPHERAQELAGEAADAAGRRFKGKSPADSARDAYRHARWMASLAREYGPDVARRIGLAHLDDARILELQAESFDFAGMDDYLDAPGQEARKTSDFDADTVRHETDWNRGSLRHLASRVGTYRYGP